MHGGAMCGLSRGPRQFRDNREQAFALNMRQQPTVMAGAHQRVALPNHPTVTWPPRWQAAQ